MFSHTAYIPSSIPSETYVQERGQSEPYARKSISQFDIIKDQQQSKNVLKQGH